MRKFLPLSLSMLMLAALAACTTPFEIFNPPPLATPQPPLGVTATPQLATPIPSPTDATSALTFEQVANMQVHAPNADRTVTLAEGQYQSGTDSASPDYLSVNLTDLYAQGDLDADGADDLAVLLAENTGGTGTFVSLIVFLNRDGLPVQTAGVLIDDRPIANSLTFAEGQVIFDGVIHGFEDPACCPAFPVIQTYRLFGERLTLTHLTSRTPGGQERIITIESPQDDARVSGSVRLTGNVTIAPFENNLAYYIFDAQTGEELAQGPGMVNAPELGGPGTFDVEIPLDAIPAGSLIRIELHDQNMADGSLFALASVTLQVP